MKKKNFKVMSLSAFVLIFVLIGLRESKGMGSYNYNCVIMANDCNNFRHTGLDPCVYLFGIQGTYSNADINQHCRKLQGDVEAKRITKIEFCNKMLEFAKSSNMCIK